jgi:transcriptional regulator with XRE-family HTH domain
MPKSMFSAEYRCLIGLIAIIRKESGFTQMQLATAIGKPQSFVSKIENGERRMDLIEMIAIADALDVQPSEILRRLEAQITRPVQL